MFGKGFFLLWGRARDKFFTGVLGRSGQRNKICRVGGQNPRVRTLCHETAPRDFANSGRGPLFWGWGSVENLPGGHARVAFFLGAGAGRASLPISAEFS